MHICSRHIKFFLQFLVLNDHTYYLMVSHVFTSDNLLNNPPDSKLYTPQEFNNSFNNNLENLSLLHANLRSINRNFEHFNDLLDSLKFSFSVIGISETWLHNNSPDMFNLPNYKLIRADRKGRRGGGVAFYINQNIKFNVRSDITFSNAETLFIEIDNGNSKNVIIGLVYRPPDSNFELFYEELDLHLHKICGENKLIFVLGDFNVNFLRSADNTNSNKFLNLMYSLGFLSAINRPTRSTLFSSTQIDNIFSNVHNNEVIGGILCSEVSDHLPIFSICKSKLTYPQISGQNLYRKESRRNIELLKQDLYLEDWIDIYDEEDVNAAYNHFNSKLQYYYEKNIPLGKTQNKRNKPKNPWITKGLLNSIRTRNRLFKSYLRNPTDTSLSTYKTYRNKLTKLIRASRKMHYSNKILNANSNTTTTWKIIKEMIGKRTEPPPTENFTLNGTKIPNTSYCANNFNSFFTSIGPDLANKINNSNIQFAEFLSERNHDSLFFNPTNPTEIINITRSLKNSKSSGHDQINMSLLKQIIHPLANPLTYIFNKSLSIGVFPELFKLAKINPIFKKDNPHEITNYRPISLLPTLSKILEKIVYIRLYTFINKHKILNPNQFGFRKNYSTDLALIQIYDKITNALANKEHVIGIFCDLSKAFDTLNYDILFSKLNHYGIRGVSLLWFKNYLKDRKQYVTFNGCTSDTLPIQCGVPQGSILGPLLFLLYVNDINNSSPILSFVLFADDTNIFFSHKNLKSLISVLNQEMNNVANWFKANKLSLNTNKTHFMYFKHLQQNLDTPIRIYIDNTQLEQKAQSKFLGVIIDECLSWNDHLHHVTMCVSRSIGIISKLKFSLPHKTLFLLYNTLTLPYITYCNSVWANCGSTKIESIFKLQKRAIRICTGSHYLAHTDPLFYKLKTLKISDLNKIQVAIVMFKFIHRQLPPSFDNMFIFNSFVHSYPTRISGNFHLTNPKLLINHKSIRHHGPDTWNDLSDNIKSCSAIHSLKATMKRSIIESYSNNTQK